MDLLFSGVQTSLQRFVALYSNLILSVFYTSIKTGKEAKIYRHTVWFSPFYRG